MRISPSFKTALLTVSCLTLLSGCSWLDDWPPLGSSKQAFRAPPPVPKVMRGTEGTWIEPEQEMKAVPVEAVQDESYKSAMKRIEQLEQSVAGMRNDLGTMLPALTRLVEAQSDIQRILKNLEPAAGSMPAIPEYNSAPVTTNVQPINNSAANNVQNAPRQQLAVSAEEALAQMRGAKPSVPQQQAPVPLNAPSQMAQPVPPPVASQPAAYQPPIQHNGNMVNVRQLRFGEHPDKTRVVFDTSGQVSFNYNIDNGQRILKVHMPGTQWSGHSSAVIGNSPLVSSYNAMPDGQNGTNIVIQLRNNAQVLWAQALTPGGNNGHRVVIDLKAL